MEQSSTHSIQKRNIPEMPKGLPNIGNNCFLSSVLQQLCKIPQIHQFFQKQPYIDQKKDQKPFLTRLSQVFQVMRSGEMWEKHQTKIDYLLSQLTQQLLNYQKGKQYDSFETLLTILNALFEQSKQLQALFSFQYKLQCSCRQLLLSEIKAEGLLTKCSQCKQSFKITVKSHPNYLLIKENTIESERKVLEFFQNEQYFYTLESRNVYNGNGVRGHYYALCSYDGYTYRYNDQYVSKVYNQNENCRFSFHKRHRYKQEVPFIKPQQNEKKNYYLWTLLPLLGFSFFHLAKSVISQTFSSFHEWISGFEMISGKILGWQIF